MKLITSKTNKQTNKQKTMQLNGYPEKLITKLIKQTLSSNSKLKKGQNLETPKLFIPYEKGIRKHCSDNLNVSLINMVQRWHLQDPCH